MSRENSANGRKEPTSIAAELKQESERLRQLAEKLEARGKELAEMEENYPSFKKFVYAKLKEHALQTVEELPEGVDLEAYAKEHGAVPYDEFMQEIMEDVKRLKEGS